MKVNVLERESYEKYMEKIRRKLQQMKRSFQDAQGKGAQKAFMEELFNDYYLHRREVYKMNFFRGIFFGLGSVLGGTIVVSLLLWILSFFVDFYVIGDYVQQLQRSLESTGK